MVGFWTLGDGVRAVWAVVVGSGGGFAGFGWCRCGRAWRELRRLRVSGPAARRPGLGAQAGNRVSGLGFMIQSLAGFPD